MPSWGIIPAMINSVAVAYYVALLVWFDCDGRWRGGVCVGCSQAEPVAAVRSKHAVKREAQGCNFEKKDYKTDT